MKKHLFLCIIAISCLMLTSCSTSALSAEMSSAKLTQGKPVISTLEFGNVIVEGVVRNDGNAKAVRVEAEATFYDSSKTILGKYSDYIDELDVGEQWRYTIMYLGLKDELIQSVSVDVRSH